MGLKGLCVDIDSCAKSLVPFAMAISSGEHSTRPSNPNAILFYVLFCLVVVRVIEVEPPTKELGMVGDTAVELNDWIVKFIHRPAASGSDCPEPDIVEIFFANQIAQASQATSGV
jgi:hypothetical protein